MEDPQILTGFAIWKTLNVTMRLHNYYFFIWKHHVKSTQNEIWASTMFQWTKATSSQRVKLSKKNWTSVTTNNDLVSPQISHTKGSSFSIISHITIWWLGVSVNNRQCTNSSARIMNILFANLSRNNHDLKNFYRFLATQSAITWFLHNTDSAPVCLKFIT